MELTELDPALVAAQVARLADIRAGRDEAAVEAALAEVEVAARGEDNLLYPMKEALAASATLGEVSDALRKVFGEHRPQR